MEKDYIFVDQNVWFHMLEENKIYKESGDDLYKPFFYKL